MQTKKLNNYLVKINSQKLLKFQTTHFCRMIGRWDFKIFMQTFKQPADDKLESNTGKYL